PSWSDGEGNGSVHERMSQLVGPGSSPQDVLLFASAGNTAERHWSGPFHDGGGGYHEWVASEREKLITPWGSNEVSVELCWQPGPSYELTLLDAVTGGVVGRTATYHDSGRCCAVARVLPESGKQYRVRVKQTGSRAGSFHLISLGGGLRYATA